MDAAGGDIRRDDDPDHAGREGGEVPFPRALCQVPVQLSRRDAARGPHFTACLGAVFLVLPPVKALTFIAVQQGLLGFYLGCSFPSMPRPNLRRAQALVAAFCADRDVPYTQTRLLASYAQALGHLAAVGRLAGPAVTSKAVPVPARR